MPKIWIGDARGRVLGPIDLDVLRELISAGRIRGIVNVSEDGTSWVPVEKHREIAELQAAQTSKARRASDLAEAERLRNELQALKGRPPHTVFGIDADAPLDVWRAAFFRLVKRFYPDALPPEAAPELRKVSEEVFVFLGKLMSYIEKQPPPPPKVNRPPPVLLPTDAKTVRPITSRELERIETESRRAARAAAPAAPASPAPPRSAPRYTPEEFVGIERRQDDRVSADVRVTSRNCGIFTDNHLLNISTGGAFIPCQEPLALGEGVDIAFKFDDAKVIQASGTVVWWSAGEGRQPRGFGLKFTSLAPEDRHYIERYIASRARS
jgi:uncharacterized protein (TIGR02266 family)